MKKQVGMLFLFMGLCLLEILVLSGERNNAKLCVNAEDGLRLEFVVNGEKMILYPWENEVDGSYYFFLPAFEQGRVAKIVIPKGEKVWMNQESVKNGQKIELTEQAAYQFEVKMEAGGGSQEYEVIFMCSANIPALFIDTESGSMEYLLESKENEESGTIKVIGAGGELQYKGRVERLSGRGNSTWLEFHKKSFALKLQEKKALCGLETGKRWNLLALYEEGSRMGTKIAMDMAQYMGLKYTSGMTWVDLYLNGEYAGNYILSETVTVGEGRVEIYDLEEENARNNPVLDSVPRFEEENSKGYELEHVETVDGGFLLEKDFSVYYEKEGSGFVTDSGNCFSIKAPEHASREQVEYIRSYIQKIEDSIENGDKEYLNYIDLDSFAKRFLVDEISLDGDANISSMYFYKEKGDDTLYAGPVWDYDNGMGECNSGWAEGHCVDYEWSTRYPFKPERLEWTTLLYGQPEFFEAMRANYIVLLSFMDELLEMRIDEYAETVRASVAMDRARWQNEDLTECMPGNYLSFDNNIRYLKYYLAKRLNYLNGEWEIYGMDFAVEGNGKIHTVNLMVDDKIIGSIPVMDGDIIQELPALDEEKYWGWYFTYSKEKYRTSLPIYEDCTLFAREKNG